MKRILFLMGFLFFLSLTPAFAEVNVGISIGVPPPLVFEGPPDVVVVPSGSAYVYMVPDFPGLYFYNNFWFRFYDGRWYRSRMYNGSWVRVKRSLVPRFVLDVPPDYYDSLPPGYHRIPYGDLRRNWRAWDRGHHWNRYDWFMEERGRGPGGPPPPGPGRVGPGPDRGPRYEERGPGPRHDERGGARFGTKGPRHEGGGPGGPKFDGGGKSGHGGGPKFGAGGSKPGGGGPGGGGPKSGGGGPKSGPKSGGGPGGPDQKK